MEEFGWILIFFVIWVFSTVGGFRKNQRKKRRRERQEGADRSGPAAGGRDLADDVAEGARRAEEALRRWETRQGVGTKQREAEAERKDAYEAIAGMLAGRDVGSGTEIGTAAEIGGAEAGSEPVAPVERNRRRERGRTATEKAPAMPLARSAPMGRTGVGETARPPGRHRTGARGLERLDRLPPLHRAIVLRELLGPPKALSPESRSI